MLHKVLLFIIYLSDITDINYSNLTIIAYISKIQKGINEVNDLARLQSVLLGGKEYAVKRVQICINPWDPKLSEE